MGINENKKTDRNLLGQALYVFNKKVELSKKLQEIKNENHSSSEQKILQIQYSSIIPLELRGKTQELIELDKMANYRGIPLLNLLSNIQFLDGKMGWRSTYIIASINKAKDRFSEPLNFRSLGKEGDSSFGFKAYTYDMKGNLIEGPAITIEIANKAGWTKKEDSSWNTLPELMLRYRAATLFGRLYAPDILDGIHTIDELVDIYSVSGSLPKEAIDQKVIDSLKESESVVITEAKAEIRASIQKTKPKLKTTLAAMLEDFDNHGWMVTNPTPHDGKFFVKVEPLTDLVEITILKKWEFGKTKNGTYIKDITSIMTEEEKNEYK